MPAAAWVFDGPPRALIRFTVDLSYYSRAVASKSLVLPAAEQTSTCCSRASLELPHRCRNPFATLWMTNRYQVPIVGSRKIIIINAHGRSRRLPVAVSETVGPVAVFRQATSQAQVKARDQLPSRIRRSGRLVTHPRIPILDIWCKR